LAALPEVKGQAMPSALARIAPRPMTATRELPMLRVVSPPADEAESRPSDAATQAAEGVDKLVLTPELSDEITRESDRLELAEPQDILRWVVGRFAPKFTMATAFGPEGMVLIHMLAEIAPATPIFNLDTGYQFKETLELREEVLRRYGIAVEMKRAETTVEEYERQNGGPLYKSNPDQCCFDRKVRVLQKAVVGKEAWASAIRRDQSPDRAKAPIVGWDKKFSLVKVSPLANWTKQDVWNFITKHNVPYNPLHDEGFTSIGCWPCTRAVLAGEDERAGRWSGFAKTECGLHSQS
jgi:phosphoadenosine phosphosulfate reductase